MTPPAASSPKALPPVRTMAWTSSTMCNGCSRSVSRVAGAPPRTSTPPIAVVSQSMTVQPVPASRLVSCPTRMPGMSVIVSYMSNRPSQPLHRLRHTFMLIIHSRTRNEQIGAGLYNQRNSLFVNTAIYLHITVQVALRDDLPHMGNFRQHLRNEILSTKAGIDGHDEYMVD